MLGILEAAIIAILIILVVVWLGKKAPETARGAGKSIAEFKQGLRDVPDAVKEVKEVIKK